MMLSVGEHPCNRQSGDVIAWNIPWRVRSGLEPVPPVEDWIGPVTLRFFTGQVFEEAMQTGKPTVDGRRAKSRGDLLVDKGVYILCCYTFGRLVIDGVDEDNQVADVVLQGAALTKATFEILLEANARLVHVGLL
jgi:hypothetical protein